MMRGKEERWLWALLINVALAQASIYVMRPMITYRALENGASSFEIGVIAAIYALVPLVVAIPMGRWVGKFGEVPLLVLGSLSFIVLAISFSFLNNIIAIASATALAGTAHLSNVAASQSMVARRSPHQLQDQNFGYFSFATSTGHTFGPMLGGLIAGSSAAILALLALVPFFFFRGLHQVKSSDDKERAGALKARDVMSRPGIKPAVWISLAVASTNDVLVVVLPLIGTENGISPVVIGTILSLRSAAAMISRFSIGRLTNKFGSTTVMNVSIFLSSTFLFSVIFAKSSMALAIVMAAIGFLLGVGQPLTMSIVSKKSPMDERAMAISIRLFGNRLGQFLVPLGSGTLASTFGGGSVFIGLGVFVASAAVVSVTAVKED
jgi:MFS family permease